MAQYGAEVLSMKRKKTTIWLDETQTQQLEKLSDSTGAPKSELIRRAINKYLAERSAELGTNAKRARKGGR